MSGVTFRIASERDGRKSCSSDETKTPEARIVGDPKEAAGIAVEMASRSVGSDRTVIISVERWGAPNRLVQVKPEDLVDRIEREVREGSTR